LATDFCNNHGILHDLISVAAHHHVTLDEVLQKKPSQKPRAAKRDMIRLLRLKYRLSWSEIAQTLGLKHWTTPLKVFKLDVKKRPISPEESQNDYF
jgi:hypothetical protein